MKIGQVVYLWNGELLSKPIKTKIEKITPKRIYVGNFKKPFCREGYASSGKEGFWIYESIEQLYEVITQGKIPINIYQK